MKFVYIFVYINLKTTYGLRHLQLDHAPGLESRIVVEQFCRSLVEVKQLAVSLQTLLSILLRMLYPYNSAPLIRNPNGSKIILLQEN